MSLASSRAWTPIVLCVLSAGCGGGGSGAAAPTAPPVGTMALSGTVTFDLVPAALDGGGPYLDYANTRAAPARGLPLEIIDSGDRSTVLASAVTDAAGNYRVALPYSTSVIMRVRAELLESGTPSWHVRVLNNTSSNALYVIDSLSFNTGTSDRTRDLHAGSGWTGSAYAEPRAAAPLAILDVIYEGMGLILASDPAAEFAPLDIYWSEANRPIAGSDGQPDPASGAIVTTFYRSGLQGGMYVLGAQDTDTDEYDRHVIAHEWGHYIEDSFSRTDSFGGPHAFGDQLDMRVAFGEGWGNAFSAMLTSDPSYRDTLGPEQAAGFDLNIEAEPRLNPGWFSEVSIQELIYDIYDDLQDGQAGSAVIDEVALGFAPLFDVLRGPQRLTPALTSLFPFIDALKSASPAATAAIDALLGVHDIVPIVDAWGSTETNDGHPDANPDVLPVYASLAVNGGPVNVCSTDAFTSGLTGSSNKLGSRRYLRFTTVADGAHTLSATTTLAPPGASTDPDLWLHRVGPIAVSGDAPTAACTPSTLADCRESFAPVLEAGLEYVVEVYEWTNTNPSDDPEYPPIGRACFDVEVTRP